jgi:hypothetical protein
MFTAGLPSKLVCELVFVYYQEHPVQATKKGDQIDGSFQSTEAKRARDDHASREGESAGQLECRWQRDQLPEAIRELVLDDQRLRNDICWSVLHAQ